MLGSLGAILYHNFLGEGKQNLLVISNLPNAYGLNIWINLGLLRYKAPFFMVFLGFARLNDLD